MRAKRWGRFGLCITAGVLLFMIVAVGLYLATSFRHQDAQVTFRSHEAGITLTHSLDLQATPLKQEDVEHRLVLRLSGKRTPTPLQVTVRYEDGLRPISVATGQNLQDVLLANTTKSFPGRFPQYTEVSRHHLTINTRRASELIFTYKSPTGDVIRQRFLLIVISDDKAAYIAAQTRDSAFDEINTEYFDKIFGSVQAN